MEVVLDKLSLWVFKKTFKKGAKTLTFCYVHLYLNAIMAIKDSVR